MKLKGQPSWSELVDRLRESDLFAYSAALAYNFLFALFPLLLFLTAFLGFLHLPTIKNFLQGPSSFLIPPTVLRLVTTTLKSVQSSHNSTVLSIGIVGFLWGMSGAFRQLINAVNHAYGFPLPLKRPLWKTYLLSFALGPFLGFLIVLAVGVAASGLQIIRWVLSRVFGLNASPFWAMMIHWVILVFLIIFILAVLFSVLPDRPEPFRWMTPGSIVSLLVWLMISLGLSYYMTHFHSYNKTYGSLGAVIALMLYLYFMAAALLLGVEVNALWHHRDNSP